MIEIRDLCYTRDKRYILKNIDLKIQPGDSWMIIGPNGAGKTTLLRIMCGLLKDYSGSVRIDGKEARNTTPKEIAQSLSYQPQFDEFSLPLKVLDILMAGRYPYKSFFKDYSEKDIQAVDQIIRMMNLEPLVNRDINTLSGGERKKVTLASAFIQDVPLILFDEPFTFLDPAVISGLKNIMNSMNRIGKTLVVVSHDFEILFPASTHILALKNGQVVYNGPRNFDKEMLRQTYGTHFERIFHNGKEIIFIDE